MKHPGSEDVEIDGWLLPKGTQVNSNMLSASRDAEIFPSPDEFQLPRQGETYRAVYGWGVHRCVGHALARTEMIEALAALTERFDAAEIVGEINVHPTTSMLGGPEALNLRMNRA